MTELPYRQIHMDFHTSPLIPGVGDEFNGEEFAAVLKENRINSINLFAKCHHGMYYYPTKIGTVHPSLKFDLLGSQIEACRKAGIRACVYTTVVWNEDWCDRHPEWMQISPDGVLGVKKPMTSAYYSWRSLCMNNPQFVEYMKAELAEIHGLYRPSGYWIDIISSRNCICASCLADMARLGLNPADHEDLAKHDRLVEIGFMRDIYAYLKDIDPEVGIYFNGSPGEADQVNIPELSTKRKREYNSYVDIESLPSDLWGYTHFPVQVNYLNKYDQELTMMNGKFHTAWGDFGSLRNLEALEYECFRALAHGAKSCVGDQLHPSGKIDAVVYRRIGQVFESLEVKEPWCTASRKIAQIGVYTPNKVLWESSSYNASLISEGVYRVLTELHHQFDFVDFEDDISGYELVILPDEITLSAGVAKKLSDYMAAGGKLLSTGCSGLSEDGNFLPCMGVEHAGDAQYNPRYFRTTEAFFPDMPPMDTAVYEQGVAVKARGDAEIWAYVTNPYFNRTHQHFCSHRHTPPHVITEEPGIVKYGNSIFIANPLFSDYAGKGVKAHKQMLKACIDALLPRPLIRCQLPTTAEITLRRQSNRIIAHMLHYIIQRKSRTIDLVEEKIPLHNQEIAIRLEKAPSKVYLALRGATPEQGLELPFEYCDGYARFVVPVIDGHEMVVMDE